MRMWADVYENRKGEYGLNVRIPMELALRLGVGDPETVLQLRKVVDAALSDRKGEAQVDSE